MKVSKKFIRLGTGSGEISASDVPSNFPSPSNYTPTSSDVKGHLEGIDNSLTASAGDLAENSFSIANNQVTFANVTGLAFANGTVRSAEIQYSVEIDATADLFESGTLRLVQRGADWSFSQTTNGDTSLIVFDVTSSGQIQYKSGNYAGFVSGDIKFRATTTSI